MKHRIRDLILAILILSMGLSLFACTESEKDNRRDVAIILYDDYNYAFELTEAENRKEVTIPRNYDEHHRFQNKVRFLDNGNETSYSHDKNALSMQLSYVDLEGKVQDTSEVYYKGTYYLRVEIPKDHDYCKPFKAELVIRVT